MRRIYPIQLVKTEISFLLSHNLVDQFVISRPGVRDGGRSCAADCNSGMEGGWGLRTNSQNIEISLPCFHLCRLCLVIFSNLFLSTLESFLFFRFSWSHIHWTTSQKVIFDALHIAKFCCGFLNKLMQQGLFCNIRRFFVYPPPAGRIAEKNTTEDGIWILIVNHLFGFAEGQNYHT